MVDMASGELLSSLEIRIEGNKDNLKALKDFSTMGPYVSGMYKVPTVLREQNEDAYTPRMVSIGPLHRGKERLQAMQEDKLSYMCCLFERTQSDQTRKICVEAMLEMAPIVRECYAKAIAVIPDDNVRLAEMMLIDGCFIIELLYRNYLQQQDPILWSPAKYYAVQHDLLLLENQIPFGVVQKLFDLTVPCMPGSGNQTSPDLIGCVLSFLGDMIGPENGDLGSKDYLNPYHILHLLHILYVPGYTISTQEEWASNCKERPAFEYSATKLKMAGVKLQRHKTGNLFDMKFTTDSTTCHRLFKRGHLEITPFSIYQSTEPLLRNLIAFEQCCPWVYNYFTSHAFLMFILIDSSKDVELLEEAGIICNHLGSSEAVSQLFNNICKNATPRTYEFYYGVRYKLVTEFCTPWRVSVGKLKQDYFGNPWTGISVAAAIILFALTFLQTYYSMFSYHHPK
ncbi:UPF0481 protein At3g47200-like [Cornus florida]|uniref:UPF0481 protein At3g47200-like n=1 Tax=Cornus florida TaxID=4283 RepID=UPI00289DF2BE|nr:UPF0481 protein At3g47200-like [Cornus florida]XP_059667519.1 UPF0481 protein At3g47200-like [Cornus florida]XP_059667520.1 UPF0481 protein At3g47200-like [Cornus florida]XP_059667521.1 UPF0481 protein At3g47200-like [Cornus florida]